MLSKLFQVTVYIYPLNKSSVNLKLVKKNECDIVQCLDESRSRQRHGRTTASRHQYSPLPKIKPHSPSPHYSRQGSPGAFLTDTDTQMVHSDRNPRAKLAGQARRVEEEEEEEEGGYGREGRYHGGHNSYRSKQMPQTSVRDAEAESRSRRRQAYNSTDPTPPPLDHGSSPRSPSPHRKGAGSKSYRANGGGYEREAAYTNNTNEDSGVAGMSPDNQYKHRDNYFRAANGKPHDQGRYKQEEEEEERRRLQELEERAQAERNRWEQDERRRREDEDRQREDTRRRAEEEEEEERRKREEDEERRRLEEEEDRKREAEKRRLEEEEELRRRNEEEEEEERRRKEEEERRRQEEEDRLKNGSEEEMDGYPSPPQMQTSSPDLDRQRDTQSAQRERAEEQKKLLEELQEARDNRQSTEKEREDLVKKAKTLQSRTQNRRNQARDVWKKRYFEEKKKTPPFEDQTNRLREELDALHRKLMAALEGPKEKNVKAGDNLPSQRNNYIIQCTRLQHDIDDMKRRVENAKMKLTAEMKVGYRVHIHPVRQVDAVGNTFSVLSLP
ncbi:hypothetical protein ACOMHN_002341 [Nucella lapillus]